MATPIGVGDQLGPYHLEAVLGRGGMGVVYLANDERLARKVAVKVVAPELVEDETFSARFIREARLAAAIDHPHILPVYEVGELDGLLFLVSRYVDGSDLRDVLLREGRLSAPRAVGIVRQIGSALDAAHARGLVHRDVKPANLLIATGDGRVDHAYLADFGLTKERAETQGLSVTGQVVGTLDYMAPEQLQGESLDGRADVYALGCVLYQTLSGQAPYTGTDVAVMLGHLQEAPPTLPDELAALQPVIDKAMAKEAVNRYASAGALSSAAVDAVATSPHNPPDAIHVPSEATAPARSGVLLGLPPESTSMVGREREIDELLSALSEAQIVTLTGPGGSGKTKLAIRVCHRSASDDPTRSALFVGLASLRQVDQVPGAVSRSLNREGLLGSWDDVYRAFAEQRALILLDNAEHLRDEVAEHVGVLRDRCPGVTLLITSRTAIRVPGEREYPLDPLPLDEATTLLIERVRERNPRYEPSDVEERELSQIAARLGGLPLAVELAAARLRVLTPRALLERLETQLDVLATSDAAIDSRQRSMRATIAWSYHLLAGQDAALFRALGVFPGSAGLDAIAAVARIDEVVVLDRLEALLDASLVRVADSSVQPRYWMLEPIRQYAAAELRELAETEDALNRLADWLLTRVRDLQRRGSDEMRATLRDEVDTVMRVISWFAEQGRWDEAVELMLRPLHSVFHQLGLTAQLEPWIRRASAQLPNPSPETHVRLVILGQWIAEAEVEPALLEEAFALATVQQLEDLQAEALRLLAEIYVGRQDAQGLQHVLTLAEEYPAARLDDNGVFIAADLVLRTLRNGWNEEFAEEAIRHAGNVGSDTARFSVLNLAAWIALQAGAADWAFTHAEQAFRLVSELRLPRLEPAVAHTAALAALETNRLEEARTFITRSLEVLMLIPAFDHSENFGRDAMLLGAAAVLAANGDHEGAAIVLGGIDLAQSAAHAQESGYSVCHPYIHGITPHFTTPTDAARAAFLHLNRLKDQSV
jgi:serine/threonine protein kinase